MKDKIYLVSPNFIKEKVEKVFEMPSEIGFVARLGLLSGLRDTSHVGQYHLSPSVRYLYEITF